MMKGSHPIHRKLLDHWLWRDKPFAKGQAWVDMIMLANHNGSDVLIGNTVVTIQKGQLYRSKLKLCKRWGWSRMKLERYFVLLEKEGMLRQQTSQQGTVITLLNYNNLHKTAFSSETTNEIPDETTTRQRRDTYNNDKNEKNENNSISNSFASQSSNRQPYESAFRQMERLRKEGKWID